MRIAVLTYHMIEESPSVLAVSPEELRAHLEAIASSGAPVLAPSLIAGALPSGAGPDGFALTFDDGYASVERFAAPLLRDFGFPFGVFLVTSRMGRDNGWPSQPSWVPRRPLLDWDAAARLAECGGEIGAHTHTHPDLTLLSASGALAEVEKSRDEIAARLGRAPSIFAYPGGRASGSARDAARRLFPASFGTRHARMTEDDDRAEIPRVEICYFRSVRRFGRLFSPGIDARLAARRALRKARRLL